MSAWPALMKALEMINVISRGKLTEKDDHCTSHWQEHPQMRKSVYLS